MVEEKERKTKGQPLTTQGREDKKQHKRSKYQRLLDTERKRINTDYVRWVMMHGSMRMNV